MKATFTLIAFSTLLTFSAFSQTQKTVPQIGQERDFLVPPIDHAFISGSRIKQVTIKDVSFSKRPTGNEELLQFDDKGRLEGLVKIQKQDTSEVLAYGYSPSGNLCREDRENRRWKQNVRRNYRLNRDATFLQGKSYEMQGGDAVMLLDTRRFQYKDGQLAKIFILAEGEIAQTNYFRYDDMRRLVQERTENADGSLAFSVDYTYNEASQLLKVQRVDHMRSKRSETFNYSYDDSGKLAEASWLKNNKLETTFTYVYGEDEQLVEIRYETLQGLRRIRGRQLIDYQAYSKEELDALWRVREANQKAVAARK